MVCAKCQKLQKTTELATPGVKRKNDIYHGSPLASAAISNNKSKTSATLGAAGIGKVSKKIETLRMLKLIHPIDRASS